ncbi:vascular cell adhesion protein 1 [Microcaecilia unicolor]|uniref:Vascular cell adhesion protein 1 n=1 Tax=Microcaecilia unicolor TaxID=1415580 RepID=A0A6P7YD06_9AMPH|nr:vascular cell adhesion protein 1 [Microcaecilia unicolor]
MAGALLTLTLLLHLLMTVLAFEIELLPAVPKFTAHFGHPLVLTCKATGCDAPRFTWRTEMDYPLAAQSQTQGSLSNLTMEHVGFQNERLYICTAMCTGFPSKQKRITIEIYSFPSDPVITTSAALVAGTASLITCTVPDVFPSDLLEVQLMKDGQILELLPYDSDRNLKNKSLTIEFNPTPEDNGKEFICLAKLSFDDQKKEPQQRQSKKKINVNYAPQNATIMVTPSSTVREGESLTLSCTAQGNPPARITWTKQSADKILQVLEGNDSITIPSAEFSDSGLYVCEARNAAGSTTVQTEVSVQGEPKIPHLAIFPSTTVKEGDNITIQCFAEGNPAAKITLRKKSEEGETVLQGARGTVHIPDVQPRDAGVYECEAENTFGTKKTSESLLVEFGPITEIFAQPSTTVKEGAAVNFTCTSSGNPAPEVSWKKYSASGTSHFISEEATLMLKDVKVGDSGLYECEGINQHGKDRRVVEFVVQVPPRETSLTVLPFETVKEGDTVVISCRSAGVPSPRIILRKKTEDEDTVLESEDGTYTIQGVQEEHAGTYKCEATNQLGQQSRTIKLNVKVPPRNTTVFVSPSGKVTEGDNVTITCRTYCNPPPLIVLKKVFPKHETIQSSSNGTFILCGVTKNDTGTYIIDVSNDVGNDTEVIQISVLEKMEDPNFNSLGITLVCMLSLAVATAAIAGVVVYKFKQARLKGFYSLVDALKMRV